ncbi:probable proline--tRNA ligase, mitochondrial isoform X2 [Acanthaster planci]|uniref:Probable proline--tRNA ligase, mitochondrial n=1 Tax=Acanthaster planci TaxID=133434 RepID=A0A8B7ZZ52_ACAPL|nr:probable proline--tRNA ligase, mitochondrial isoform X2 [Acanthaster planci]
MAAEIFTMRGHQLMNHCKTWLVFLQFDGTMTAEPARALCTHHHHCVSKMFQPSYILPKGMRQEGITCKSQRLMMENGLIRPAGTGIFHLLPLAQRALDKLIRVIESEMSRVGSQKMAMPSLTSSALWKTSGRWDMMGSELFKLRDRHKTELCLGPTHEEAVTDIIAAEGLLSHKRLPIRLYQITAKFRDEPRPRFGLLRGREFIMKDLYTFDSSEATALDTYDTVCDAYTRLFKRLQVDFVKVVGDTGSIGGSLSHEYHLLAETGEDELFQCDKCGLGANAETTVGGTRPSCPEKLDEVGCPMRLRRGIEVGHAFLLGSKYSKLFKACYADAADRKQLIEMGCYGLGVTRILAASIEVLSSEDEIRWPQIIAPYQVYIIPPKRKSKDEAAIPLAETLCNDITSCISRLQDELLLDDRDQLTIGRRVTDAKKLGYPYLIVVGKRALEAEPLYELHDTQRGTIECVSKIDLFKTLESRSVV